MGTVKKPYSEEFKAQLVQEVEDTGHMSSVAKVHGVSASTLHGWIGKTRTKKKKGQGEDRDHGGSQKGEMIRVNLNNIDYL